MASTDDLPRRPGGAPARRRERDLAVRPRLRRGARARRARRRRAARRRGAPASTRCWSRRSARATCSTTRRPRLIDGADGDLRLLAGDYLYALGLERLAARGDLEAVSELADLISLSAQVHAENGRRRPAGPAARALWLASTVAVGAGATAEHERAKEALRHGRADAADRLLRSAAGTARRGGHERRAGRRSRLDRLRRRGPPRTWLTRDNDKQGAPKGLPKPDPPGYFEGESMTRRNAFTVAVQAVGGLAGAAIVLPAIGFAVAPLFEQEDEPWQAVGPARRLHARHLQAGRDHRGRGHRRDRQDDRLRASGQPGAHRGQTKATRRRARRVHRDLDPLRPPRLPGPLRRRPPATSSAPVTAASTTSWASGSAARRCARSTASRPASPTARSRSARATASPTASIRCAPAIPGEFTGGVWNYLYPPRPSVPPPP